MRKILNILSGLYITAIGLLLGFGTFVTINRSNNDLISQYGFKIVILINGFFVTWLLATGIGLLTAKNWARYSLFLMSFGALALGALILAFAFRHPFPAPISVEKSSIFLSVNIILLGIIPLFFLIFYNLKFVKELFISKADDSLPK